MAPKITKANGHIVQADWTQNDASQMDYIHNKPDLNLFATKTDLSSLYKSQIISDTEITLSMQANCEYQCTSPVTSVTISDFATGLDDIPTQYSIIFTAGDTISVTHPATVKWALATPIFDPKKTYWLSFIPFGNYYLGTWTAI